MQEKTGNEGKISDGHVSIKYHLTCENIWDKFEMKYVDDYLDHYLKKDVYYQQMFLKSLLIRA